LAATLGGRGGFAAVCGDAGLGKSRLCRELIKGSPVLGILVTVGRAVPSGASMPYRPLAEAVLGLLRPRGDWIDEPQLTPWLPVLAQMVPVPGVLPAGQTSSAARGEAMLRLLGWLGAEHGLLMVLEDLHWADPDTLDVIEYLADNVGREPVLCVATLRRWPPTPASDLADRLATRNSASVIELAALDEPAVDAIAHACAPAITSADLARIRRAADGIPFLIEELVGSPGVPRSFAESVRARTLSLEPAQVDVLVAAALLGRNILTRTCAGRRARRGGVARPQHRLDVAGGGLRSFRCRRRGGSGGGSAAGTARARGRGTPIPACADAGRPP